MPRTAADDPPSFREWPVRSVEATPWCLRDRSRSSSAGVLPRALTGGEPGEREGRRRRDRPSDCGCLRCPYRVRHTRSGLSRRHAVANSDAPGRSSHDRRASPMGDWISAPGGLPVPVHFTAIWAEGYSAFVRGDYRATVQNLQRRVQRQDLIEALESIPNDLSSSEPSLNPVGSLRRATIRLQPVTP